MDLAKNAYDWTVVIVSRGVGSVLVAGLFLIKKFTLPSTEFTSLGLAFASVLALVGTLVAPLVMLMSRRVIQSRRIETDRTLIKGLLAAIILAASLSTGSLIVGTSPSEPAFVLSLAAIVLVTALNGQYVIWLNEIGCTRRSLLFVLLFLSVFPISLIIRLYFGFGRYDRSLGPEALMLCLPVLVDTSMRDRAISKATDSLYHMSFHNYAKYAVFIGFFNAIPAADWWLGQRLLADTSYEPWANLRILFERGLLPLMNVAQAAILWRLLRASIGEPGSGRAVIPAKASHRLLVATGCVFIATFVIWAIPSLTYFGEMAALFVGYAAYATTSIFLEFYQAKYSLAFVGFSLAFVFILRGLASYSALELGGAHLFSIVWAATALATLAFVFNRSRDQIALGRKS